MRLQKPTAFGPFVRQLIIFAFVASRAGDDNVVRRIVSTARQRHDMIHVVNAVQFIAAIIAFVMLPLLLAFHVLRRISSGAMPFCRSPFSFTYSMWNWITPSRITTYLPRLSNISVISAVILFFGLFRMLFAPNLIVYSTPIWMLGVPFARRFARAFQILISPLSLLCSIAFFTQSINAEFAEPLFAKFRSRIPFFAGSANLSLGDRQVQHSVSLSLRPVLNVVRVAGLTTFSLIRLDHLPILSQNGAVCND